MGSVRVACYEYRCAVVTTKQTTRCKKMRTSLTPPYRSQLMGYVPPEDRGKRSQRVTVSTYDRSSITCRRAGRSVHTATGTRLSIVYFYVVQVGVCMPRRKSSDLFSLLDYDRQHEACKEKKRVTWHAVF